MYLREIECGILGWKNWFRTDANCRLFLNTVMDLRFHKIREFIVQLEKISGSRKGFIIHLVRQEFVMHQ
jgi:hypothetical protein